tara:strand:- start:493 stop:1236 length:744 start_codon:yes stop_codon:yes gene_type:complete
MIFIISVIYGLISIISYYNINDKLQKKYYNKNVSNIQHFNQNKYRKTTINDRSFFPLDPYTQKVRSLKQKIYYSISLSSVGFINTFILYSFWTNKTKLYVAFPNPFYSIYELIICFIIQDLLYYIYHRLMHTKFLYNLIHKDHHYYRHPEPFDSLIGHPLEHIMSGIIAITPAFLLKINVFIFMLYMSIIGFIGIIEHCGIEYKFGFYSSRDHYFHHLYGRCNYGGTVIPLCDILFKTRQTKMKKIM